jgi:hypothetical protein
LLVIFSILASNHSISDGMVYKKNARKPFFES